MTDPYEILWDKCFEQEESNDEKEEYLNQRAKDKYYDRKYENKDQQKTSLG